MNNLSQNKRALLALRLQQKKQHQPAAAPTIPRLPREGQNYPLSFAQYRLWFLDQLEPNSLTYNTTDIYQMTGTLNQAALSSAFQHISQRHEILRTTFPTINGEPVQQIASSVTLPMFMVDLCHLAGMAQEIELKARIAAEQQVRLDLAQGPLLRVILFQLAAENHILLVLSHHIIGDGWSSAIFMRELTIFYNSFLAGQSVSNQQNADTLIAPLPIQYVDFAQWQRSWLEGEIWQEQLNYWKEILAGNLPILQFPTDLPNHLSHQQGDQQRLIVPATLVVALQTLSQQAEVSLFMTLLATFKLLLYRYTQQEDIIVGSPIAGRQRVETENLIGLFLNMLPMRTDISGQPTFRELLNRVRKTTLGAYAHQDIPFDALIKELQPERNLNRHPIFDLVFNFITTHQALDAKLTNLTMTPRPDLVVPDSHLLFTLYVETIDDTLELRLVYQRDILSSQRMGCFLEQFRYLLEQISLNPDQSIQKYSLVTPEFASRYPLNLNQALPEPTQPLVADMVREWAERTPNQPAIEQNGQTWNYRELFTASQSISQILLGAGCQGGARIAVYGERTFGLIAALLGALQVGIIVPISPSLPPQRRQLILQEAQVNYLLVVTESKSLDLTEPWWPQTITPCYINPMTGVPLESKSLDLLELPKITETDSAYIFFTSGSTGMPKGVLGWHKGLSHFLNWQREQFSISPTDRVAQLIDLSFDAVLRDIFLPLTSGGMLCLPTLNDISTPEQTVQWLAQRKITIVHTVPSLAQLWLKGAAGQSLPALRWLFCSGEPLTDSLIQQWRNAFAYQGEIVNFYGATEVTMIQCFYQTPHDKLIVGHQPAGRPLPETQALVVNPTYQLCGVNEPGEIIIRTPFRTQGYLNGVNAPRFRPNPYRNDEQDWLYHTGDQGRYRPDGLLEVLGRQDNQIKIRGIRIELGEIEAALSQHPAVQQCVIIAQADPQGEKQLVAYWVAATPTLLAHELRQYLLNRLPKAMIPAMFMELSQLPLLPNGKIDRQALPKATPSNLERAHYSAPRNPTEQKLAAIWQEVLGVAQVGIHDDFFDLGGHSLLATQIMSRIRQQFQHEISLRALFEKTTIATLAELFETDTIDPLQQLLAEIAELSDEEVALRLAA